MAFIAGFASSDTYIVIRFSAQPVINKLDILFGEHPESDSIDTLQGKVMLAHAMLLAVTGDTALSKRYAKEFYKEHLQVCLIAKSWMFTFDQIQQWIDKARVN